MSRAQVTPERIAEIRDRAKANADVRDLLTALEAQQNLADERAAILRASVAEMDELRARAESAKNRQSAAEYRAQRIVLDKDLQDRAESAERQLATVTQELAFSQACNVTVESMQQERALAVAAVEKERNEARAERDALKQERDAALAAHKTDRRELHAIASRYEAALVRIRDNSGDPVVKRIATNALGG